MVFAATGSDTTGVFCSGVPGRHKHVNMTSHV